MTTNKPPSQSRLKTNLTEVSFFLSYLQAHKEKKDFKKTQDDKPLASRNAPLDQALNLPEKIKENLQVGRSDREQKPKKDIGTGHTHDRRSGTGRYEHVRKEGGGYGNLGNAKDEQNTDKYIKQEGKEAQEVVEGENAEEKKPEEPQGVTLNEYYKSKGVQLVYNAEKKAPVKKTDLNAQWIKKEKLTIVETKEDKKLRQAQEGKTKKVKKSNKVEEEEQNIETGFGQKAAPTKREENRDRRQKVVKKGGKVSLDDDFPTL